MKWLGVQEKRGEFSAIFRQFRGVVYKVIALGPEIIHRLLRHNTNEAPDTTNREIA